MEATLNPTLTDAEHVLQGLFGHPSFRPGQATAVRGVLDGRDALVVLPTGGGKSACYQVPAVLWRRAGRGCTVVVSPLIALMDDQVRGLTARGIPAVALHSGHDAATRREILRTAPDATLVYVSPERLALAGTRRWLDRIGVAAFAIDEAHCISEWGHDFRKDYQRLGELRDLWDVPVIALTATATPGATDDIVRALRLREPVLVRTAFNRDNLALSVEHHRGDKVRVERAIHWLERVGIPRGRRGGDGRAVIYAGTRKRVVKVAKTLRDAGFAVAHYHAGRTDSARATAQARFAAGAARVLVATTAFGMGIDLPDIRLVLHVTTPPTLESYVQQAGRAGRDGEAAHAVLLYAPGDAVTRRRVVKAPTPGEQAGWRAMQDYAFGDGCRQLAIAAWFGVDGHACGTCDVCTDREAVVTMVAEARDGHRERQRSQRSQQAAARESPVDADARDLVVEFVAHLAKPVGKRLVALGLRGSKAKPVQRARLTDNPCYGALKAIPEAALIRAVEELLEEGRLVRKGRKYPTVWIPDKRVRRPSTGASTSRRTPVRTPLERALHNLRRRESRRRRIKPYMVFQDATLHAIAAALPTDARSLAAVPGMGPKRLARYGDVLLAIVAEHRDDGPDTDE